MAGTGKSLHPPYFPNVRQIQRLETRDWTLERKELISHPPGFSIDVKIRGCGERVL